ncbi:hypothetical protein ACT1U9_09970 [Streptomyces sp. BR1]|uniref:hypothetical protein n=1 Tax=Streptomyces sp. BR1 TaxID=1592323 RepID=UPI00402B4BBD
MRVNRKFLVAAVVCTTAVTGLAGCGGKDGDGKAKDVSDAKKPTASATPADTFAAMTADAIADKAVATTKAATSFKVTGEGLSKGERMRIDLTLNRQGDCTGKIAMKGGTAELLKSDAKSVYMKGDENFYRAIAKQDHTPARQADAMVEILKGRWMKLPADAVKSKGTGRSTSPDGGLAKMCEVTGLVQSMDDNPGERTGMTKGADTVVGGVPAVTLTKTKTDGRTLTMYVAKQGPAYLLKVDDRSGKDPGTITFADYDKPVTITPPPSDQVLDLQKMGMKPGGGSGSGGTGDLKA